MSARWSSSWPSFSPGRLMAGPNPPGPPLGTGGLSSLQNEVLSLQTDGSDRLRLTNKLTGKSFDIAAAPFELLLEIGGRTFTAGPSDFAPASVGRPAPDLLRVRFEGQGDLAGLAVEAEYRLAPRSWYVRKLLRVINGRTGPVVVRDATVDAFRIENVPFARKGGESGLLGRPALLGPGVADRRGGRARRAHRSWPLPRGGGAPRRHLDEQDQRLRRLRGGADRAGFRPVYPGDPGQPCGLRHVLFRLALSRQLRTAGVRSAGQLRGPAAAQGALRPAVRHLQFRRGPRRVAGNVLSPIQGQLPVAVPGRPEAPGRGVEGARHAPRALARPGRLRREARGDGRPPGAAAVLGQGLQRRPVQDGHRRLGARPPGQVHPGEEISEPGRRLGRSATHRPGIRRHQSPHQRLALHADHHGLPPLARRGDLHRRPYQQRDGEPLQPRLLHRPRAHFGVLRDALPAVRGPRHLLQQLPREVGGRPGGAGLRPRFGALARDVRDVLLPRRRGLSAPGPADPAPQAARAPA